MVNDRHFEVMLGENGKESRELSWLQIMLLASMSQDGKLVTIGGLGGSSGPTSEYSVYLVKLDDGEAVLLGKGIAGSISPDNKWVTSISPAVRRRWSFLHRNRGLKRSPRQAFNIEVQRGRAMAKNYSSAPAILDALYGFGYKTSTAARPTLSPTRA